MIKSNYISYTKILAFFTLSSLFACKIYARQPQRDVFIIVTDEENKLRDSQKDLAYARQSLSSEDFVKLVKYNSLVKNKISTVRTRIERKGARLENLRTASMACSAVRTTLQTGHLPTLHGVWQTDGLAKGVNEVARLSAEDLPTMGSYFKEAGYDTIFIGKSHFSRADLQIRDSDGQALQIVDDQGRALPENIEQWRHADVLADYGYSNWIGPEPHGADIKNTGMFKDKIYVNLALQWLNKKVQEREKKRQLGLPTKPLFMVLNVVNPHDICLFPAFIVRDQFKQTLDLEKMERLIPFSSIPVFPSDADDLSDKPSTQRSYRDVYTEMFVGPVLHNWLHDGRDNVSRYRQYYTYFLKHVDDNLDPFLNFIEKSDQLKNNAYVLMLSDHGDGLGTRQDELRQRGFFQKWHNYYTESTAVPAAIFGPDIKPGLKVKTHMDTTDISVLMYGLAQLDMKSLNKTMSQKYRKFKKPVGRNYASLLKVKDKNKPQPVGISYFLTQDHPSLGNRQQFAAAGQIYILEVVSKLFSCLPFVNRVLPPFYREVEGPVGIEGLVTKLSNGHTYKIARYFYTEDQKRRYEIRGEVGIDFSKDEWELYDLDQDPFELKNLFSQRESKKRERRILKIAEEMLEKMIAERKRKALDS